MSLETQMASPLNKYRGEGIGSSEVKKRISSERSFADVIRVNFESMIDSKRTINEFPILKPDIILEASRYLITSYLPNLQDNEVKYVYSISSFLAGLIQKSYDNGYNNFKLESQIPLHIGSLHGKKPKDKGLKITYKGDLLAGSFHLSSNIDATIQGNVIEPYALNLKNSRMIVAGQIDKAFSMGCENSILFFSNKKRYPPGYVFKGGILHLDEDTKLPFNCAEITENKEDYGRYIDVMNLNNTMILVKDGKEIERKGNGRFKYTPLEKLIDLEKIK